MDTSEDRLEAAVDAAAHTLHDMSRERWHPRWENVSTGLQEHMKAFVRPLVEAALEAADRKPLPPNGRN
ncbi:MAG: hypothetical protein ABS59_02930 [Methylobacterium sp. SCN 67-24]|nr:MAG: hypothetical protein ABS59_02930 [Methylobacterium sp. SCN 67-24]